jgi:hypothetical protein
VTHVKGIANGLSDYLSRNPIDGPLNTGDGELFRDKLLTNQRGELQFTEQNVPVGWMDSANDEAEVAAAAARSAGANATCTRCAVVSAQA